MVASTVASTMVASMEYDMGVTKTGHNKYVKKSLVWIICVVFLVLIIVVGVLSGVLSAKKARADTEAKYEKIIKETLPTTPTTHKTTTLQPITTNPKTKTTPQTLTTTPGPCSDVWCAVRLPTNIIPSHYNLFLATNVTDMKYRGKETIDFRVTNDTNVIIIHIKQIRIDSVKVNTENATSELKVSNSFYFPENEYYVIRLAENMKIGDYKLSLDFHANVSSLLTGFYKSAYKEGGIEKMLLTTKFQPTDARKAYPCFDEPNLKATFTITVNHPVSYKARSNMPGTTKTLPSARAETSFNKTVKMSTYLVCFIVSQFKYKFEKKAGIGNNVTVAIWSRPDYVDSTEYAFNISTQMLTYLEEFLGVAYPMPKLDMFAIPDYGSGATEHWGIITYRESRLLYTPGNSSKSNQRSTAGIVAHESAHLWFGNLVTCKWWNDLWVQEGMASYLEYYAMNNSHPEWNMIDSFLINDWKTGMSLDALASSHPISQPVDHPRQIKEIFDAITYNKGASLFQMLDYFLGIDKFREGLNVYLTKNQYKGATVKNLWDAFSQVSKENITSMMNTWTYQMGFPVVTISKQNSTFILTQKHFLIDKQAKITQKSPYNYKWIIPFSYATGEDLNKKNVLVIDKGTAQINSTAKWLLGNFDHRGFYRVNYDTDGWKSIKDNFKKFSATDRAGVIDDAFTLARSGEVTYDIPLDLLSSIDNDTSSIVWSMVLGNLNYLDSVLSSQNIYKRYQSFVSSKIKPLFKKSGTSYLRSGCNIGLEEAIQEVKKMFQNWKVNGTMVPANVRSTVYYCGVANGNSDDWEFVYNQFLGADNPSERSKLQSALGATQNIWILNKWLESSIDNKIVRAQDTAYVISGIASRNPVGKYLAWSFASNNWEAIMKIAKENNFHVARLTSGLTSQFATAFDLKETEKLWKRYPNAGTGKKAREQGIEKIKANIGWLKANYETVEAWLNKNFKE